MMIFKFLSRLKFLNIHFFNLRALVMKFGYNVIENDLISCKNDYPLFGVKIPKKSERL